MLLSVQDMFLSDFARTAKGEAMLAPIFDEQPMHPDCLKQPCTNLLRVLHLKEEAPETLHDDIFAVIGERAFPDRAVIFFRKWINTPGRLAFGNRREEYRAEQTQSMQVIFVDGWKGSSYLLHGINAAYEAGAISIGLFTDRRFFTDEELSEFAAKLAWVFVADVVEDQRRRFDKFCPNTVFPLPYLRQRAHA